MLQTFREGERERLPDVQQTSKMPLMGKPTSSRVSGFDPFWNIYYLSTAGEFPE